MPWLQRGENVIDCRQKGPGEEELDRQNGIRPRVGIGTPRHCCCLLLSASCASSRHRAARALESPVHQHCTRAPGSIVAMPCRSRIWNDSPAGQRQKDVAQCCCGVGTTQRPLVYCCCAAVLRCTTILAMCSRGLRTSLLSVVVGAATVESMSLTVRSGGSSLGRVLAARSSQTPATRRMSMSVDAGLDAARYATFIKEKVCVTQYGTSTRVHVLVCVCIVYTQ